MRELYIYYRVAAHGSSAALNAVVAMQQLLRQRHPALQARLLRRPDTGPDGLQTWMETYALPGRGIDPALEQEIAQAAQRWAAHVEGSRHCEAFIPCA